MSIKQTAQEHQLFFKTQPHSTNFTKQYFASGVFSNLIRNPNGQDFQNIKTFFIDRDTLEIFFIEIIYFLCFSSSSQHSSTSSCFLHFSFLRYFEVRSHLYDDFLCPFSFLPIEKLNHSLNTAFRVNRVYAPTYLTVSLFRC